MKRDRLLYRAHVATFLIGVLGVVIVCLVTVTGSIALTLSSALIVVASLLVAVSGVLAMIVKRTLFTPKADAALGALDSYESDGDSLMANGAWQLDLWGNYTRATTPLAILLVGLVFMGLGIAWFVSANGGPPQPSTTQEPIP